MGEGVGVRVLGTVALERDGVPVDVPSKRQRVILALLTAAAGEAVPGDVLIDAVWGERLPARPDAALRTQVTRLRQLLGDVPGSLTHRDAGYTLRVERVDAWRFERAVRDAESAPAPQRAEQLAGALSLWRGRAYAEVADRPFVQPVAVRLEELRSRAAEEHADALLEAGDVSAAVTTLEGLVADDPLREHPRATLMRALYAAGRASDALATYQEYRRMLGTELGLTPSPAIAELERSILTHQLPDASRDAPQPRPAVPPPEPVSELIGRVIERTDLSRLLDTARVVTVTGPGGVGKTRLVMHVVHDVAARYPDGVWWCDLSSVTGDDVAAAVASALGIEERAGDTLGDRVLAVLQQRRALIVFDNCEHVVAPLAELADPLVRGAPGVDVLVTSREPLGIDGEHRLRLGPLPVPVDEEVTDALLLFLRRARAANPAATTDGVAWDAALEICRTLDGLPLALEFAAARVATMSVADVARQLDHRFELLTSARGSIARRHSSLSTALAWSYQLLAPDEQRTLDALSTFAGEFSLDDAQRLWAADDAEVLVGSVARLVASLVDKSLVELIDDEAVTKYRLLESVRAYSAERLAAAGSAGASRRRHAAFAVELAASTDAALRGPEEPLYYRVFDDHAGDLRSARSWMLATGDLDGLLRLCASLRWFTDARPRSEPVRWAESAAAWAVRDAPDHPLLPEVLAHAACGAVKRGQLDDAAVLATRADEVSQRSSGCGLELLGRVAMFRGDLDGAIRLGREAASRHRERGDDFFATLSATLEVLGLRYAGHHDEARHAVEELLDDADSVGSVSLRAMCQYCAGEVFIDDRDRSRSHLVLAATLARSTGAEFIHGLARTTLAGIDVRAGHREAFSHVRDALEHWQRAGAWKQQWWVTLRLLIELLSDAGHHRDAAVLAAAFDASVTTGPVYGDDAGRLQTAFARAREGLGIDELAAATAAGAALDDAAALAYGRAALDDVAAG